VYILKLLAEKERRCVLFKSAHNKWYRRQNNTTSGVASVHYTLIVDCVINLANSIDNLF